MINIEGNKFITYKLVPDKFLENNKCERLADALYDLNDTPIDRISLGRKGFSYKKKSAFFFEIVLTNNNVEFYISVPKNWKRYTKNQLETCWNKATINQSDCIHLNIDEKGSKGAIMHLSRHYFLSLKTDKRILSPLKELMEVTNSMSDDDKAIVQFCFKPAGRDYFSGYQEAYDKFKDGKMPKRIELNSRRLIEGAAKFGYAVAEELRSTAAFIITEDEEDLETEELEDLDRANMVRQGGLSNSTKQKARYNAFDTTTRVLAYSKQANRRKAILRGITTSYRSLSEDNELTAEEKNVNKITEQVQERKVPPVKINPDYLSTREIAKLIQLPPHSLQKEYDIENVSKRELEVPKSMQQGAIKLGNITVKGDEQEIYWPENDTDELCLPRVCIGSMGSGKSLGYGAGFATDAIRAGYSCFTIDVSDGDMANTIRDSLPSWFPENHIIDLDFGNEQRPIPLNWREISTSAIRSRKVSNIMADQLVNYLNKFSEDMGARTERYMKSAAKAVYNYDSDATILEIMLMLLSDDYRSKVIESMPEGRQKDMWEDFDGAKETMQRQITQPILNRFDSIIGSEDIANCIMQKPEGKINFRKWADGDDYPYCVILRVPKSKLFEKATDALATYLISKLWLSILTRMDQPTNERQPCFLILDEPHQFISSANQTWRKMIVESRKWRLGLVFMFHDWGQLPKDLTRLIKSAGPHYTIYSSSKATFQDLKEEIKPFEVEEALKIPTHHAINIIKHRGKYQKFMAEMAKPPIKIDKKKSWRHEYNNRSSRTEACSMKFGSNINKVEDSIYERESMIY